MRRRRAVWANGSVTSILNLNQIGLTRNRARCSDGNGTLSSIFFSDDDFEIARAQAICRSCPLQATCLEGALEREETYGVWGGIVVAKAGRRVDRSSSSWSTKCQFHRILSPEQHPAATDHRRLNTAASSSRPDTPSLR